MVPTHMVFQVLKQATCPVLTQKALKKIVIHQLAHAPVMCCLTTARRAKMQGCEDANPSQRFVEFSASRQCVQYSFAYYSVAHFEFTIGRWNQQHSPMQVVDQLKGRVGLVVQPK